MLFRVSPMRLAINLGVALALGLSLWSCGAGTPAAPTPPDQMNLPGLSDAASASLATVSWECFTAGDAGAFGSASGCPARRLSPQSGRVAAAAVPAGPSGLTRGVSGTTVTLQWLAPAGGDPVTSYVVEAGSTPGSINVASFDTGNTQTTLTVNNVPSGLYFVRVRGRNASGTGPASNEVTVTITITGLPCTPNPPTGLTGTVSGTTVTLSWQAPAGSCGALGYGIGAGDAPGRGNLAQVQIGSGATTTFVANNVPSGSYYISLVAIGPGGNVSAPSNEITLSVGPPPPPGSVPSTWVGLVSNGDGSVIPIPAPMTCGVMRADLTFNLNTVGTSFTGTQTATIRVSPGGCVPIGFTQTSVINGTISGSSISFTVTESGGRSFAGTATVTGTRMTGSINSMTTNGQIFVITFSANLQ